MKKLAILFSTLLLAACSLSTSRAPVAIQSPTTTLSPTSHFALPTPHSTTSPLPSSSPTPTSALRSPLSIQIALVDAAGEPGKDTFGCGDRIVMVETGLTSASPLRAAVERLLSVHTRDYGASGLITAFDQSNLRVSQVTITDGVATIELTGTVSMSGTCDSPRIQEQMRRTILQFSTLRDYHILLNGSERNWICLFDASGRCEE